MLLAWVVKQAVAATCRCKGCHRRSLSAWSCTSHIGGQVRSPCASMYASCASGRWLHGLSAGEGATMLAVETRGQMVLIDRHARWITHIRGGEREAETL